MGQNNDIVIRTKNLSKIYGTKAAVNHLDLEIRKGEVFGLLGPNGAGKTTTIMMLLGLTEPTVGQASIYGIDCTRNAIDIKRVAGYLPDNPGFYPDMTGRQNLRFTACMNGLQGEETEKRITQLLERTGMTEAADKKTGTYSKGMKQRLGIADVLIKDPQIIIMDEPTLGLDPEGMRELLELIRQLSKEDGRTLMISSHQLYQVQQICDRVGIFVEGQLVACGKIEELGNQVQQENHYSMELQVEPCDDRLLGAIAGQDGVQSIEKEGNMFIVQSTKDMRKSLSAFLGKGNYTILHMHQRGGDLDEIYRLYFEKAGQKDESNSKKQNHREYRHL
ncbi:MAG: ABC transporter ATP-binding protein [Eubacteriales bacterium]|nr:ABC transporter ATP-binding protein [Eubacteriales bacterium]